jgi:hypothetical protein
MKFLFILWLVVYITLGVYVWLSENELKADNWLLSELLLYIVWRRDLGWDFSQETPTVFQSPSKRQLSVFHFLQLGSFSNESLFYGFYFHIDWKQG